MVLAATSFGNIVAPLLVIGACVLVSVAMLVVLIRRGPSGNESPGAEDESDVGVAPDAS